MLLFSQAHEETAAQYEDIMSKIQTLNVLNDSNRLIREEKDSLAKQVRVTTATVVMVMGDFVAGGIVEGETQKRRATDSVTVRIATLTDKSKRLFIG